MFNPEKATLEELKEQYKITKEELVMWRTRNMDNTSEVNALQHEIRILKEIITMFINK